MFDRLNHYFVFFFLRIFNTKNRIYVRFFSNVLATNKLFSKEDHKKM